LLAARSVQVGGTRDGGGYVARMGDWGCHVRSAADDDCLGGDGRKRWYWS
jgi:hypothetical protein